MSYQNNMTKTEQIAMLEMRLRESDRKLMESNSKLRVFEKKYENEEKSNENEEKSEEVLTQRNIIPYEDAKLKRLKRNIQSCKNEILNNHEDGTSIIHQNQDECSKSIVSELRNREIINVMLLALTQSGKTGTMCALIKNYIEDNIIPIENIYIITGLSSIDWIEQTKERMPRSIQDRIFHRGNLNRGFINDIKDKKNVLIIIDEIQVAAKKNQSLHIVFQHAGFYDKQNLLKNDIKIVEFTATPDGTIYDLMDWGENAFKIQMNPGEHYTGCFDMLNDNKVKQYKDLCCYDKKTGEIDDKILKENINNLIDDVNSFDSPMYHIIRTPTGFKSELVIENFKNYYNNELEYHMYDQSINMNLNDILVRRPEVHTFIFIKEKLRCAKTLTKTFLGIVYERFTSTIDDAVIIQGLIGRMTGYDYNGQSICYTNKISIEKYKILWESNFEDKSVKWKSKTTKIKEDGLISKGTYNMLSKHEHSISNKSNNIEPNIVKFNTFEEVREYFKNVLKNKDKFKNTRGPNKKSIEKKKRDGFYTNQIRGNNKVMSFSEIEIESKAGLNNKSKFRLHTCYENVNDPSTLQFWLIYYD